MKKILIHTLLRSYSYMVIGIVVFFASVLSYINWQQYQERITQHQQVILNTVTEELDAYNSSIRQRMTSFSLDKDRIEGMYKYFQLPPDQYQMWLLKHDLLLIKEVSLQKTIQSIYQDYAFVSGIDIVLNDSESVYLSTSRFKSGTKVAASDYKAPVNSIPIILKDAATSSSLGTVYVSIDTTAIDLMVQRESEIPFSLVITDSLDRVFYKKNSEVKKKYRIISKDSGDLSVEVGVPQAFMYKEVGKLTALIFLASSSLILLLLFLLNRVFHYYKFQVGDIVKTVQQITDGDTNVRIETRNKQQEMLLIASQVNQMLDTLDKNISDIYRLEIKQQEANMRALQSQINPHFLYNTLEFFRMYAVTKDLDELSDMIYEFSSLLRGSISQSNVTTIKEELEFCEKHSYICQIRYPRSIAYAYQIDKGCENIAIPRFVIQPLVENYFVHGVDLTRKDNALSVKVLKHKEGVEILIRDNGKGMSQETLETYQTILKSRKQIALEEGKSIGIINVHERLLLFFGERYHMTLASQPGSGVTYSINIKQKLEQEEGAIHESINSR
ncbi:sensor histidine kinase [Streptococcus cameli]